MKRPMKMPGKRPMRGAPTGPDYNLLGGLKAAAPKRALPQAPRASAAGYRGRGPMKGMPK